MLGARSRNGSDGPDRRHGNGFHDSGSDWSYRSARSHGFYWSCRSYGSGLTVPGPMGAMGPTGATGPTGSVVIVGQLLIQPDVLYPGSVPFFFPVNSVGDPTQGGTFTAFRNAAVVMPISCTSATLFIFQQDFSGELFIFQQDFSGDRIKVTLYRSAGGTGTYAATGLSATAGNNAGGSGSAAVTIAAGDTIAFQLADVTVRGRQYHKQRH